MIKELLKLRRKIKNRKPIFHRSDSHKKSKLTRAWRKPRGMHNKIRLNKKGYNFMVSTGYGSPVAVKGLSKEGLKRVKVNNVSELSKINVKTDMIIIGSTVGQKKRIEIIKESQKNGMTIGNIKNVDKFVKNAEEKFNKRKEEKKQHVEEKVKKIKEKEEKGKKKEDKKEKSGLDTKIENEDEKKAKDKKEMDKALIHNQ